MVAKQKINNVLLLVVQSHVLRCPFLPEIKDVTDGIDNAFHNHVMKFVSQSFPKVFHLLSST